MKLLRYGEPGSEKSGLLDDKGQIRDLSAAVGDIGPVSCRLPGCRDCGVSSRLTAGGSKRDAPRSSLRRYRQVHRGRPELLRPRDRIEPAHSEGARPLFKGRQLLLGPNDNVMLPENSVEVRLGS